MLGSLTQSEPCIGYSDGMLWDPETGADLSTRHMSAETAEFIVRVCDAHDELVTACTIALEAFVAMGIRPNTRYGKAYTALSAAVAKTEGRE